MPTLCRAPLTARLVLLAFVAAMLLALAAPIVQPRSLQVLCSSSVKLLVATDEGLQELGPQLLDCPLCLPASAPPPSLGVNFVRVRLPAALAQATPTLAPPLQPAGPPPARGPPLGSV